MRIRTQLRLAAVAALALALLVVGCLLYVTQRSRQSLDEQAQSQDVARGVANMLSLTNEVAVYGSERAIAQWRARHAALLAAVDAALRRHTGTSRELLELRSDIAELGDLFETLASVGHDPGDTLAPRRRELLLERLLIETQAAVESRHRWAVAVEAEQRQDHGLYTAMVLLAPASLLALGIWFGLLVRRRLLLPLDRLETVVTAIRGGDLGARCNSIATDELGDTARAVDSMAQTLVERTEALKTSQQRLQLITDNMPALVCYVDAQERYVFVNAQFTHAGLGEPNSLVGRTMREVRGDESYARVAPHVARVLAGQPVTFETTRMENGRIVHRQSTYVPDVAEGRDALGFFALSLDVTERKEVELRLAASEHLLQSITTNLPALVAYIDGDRCYRFANARFQEWLGVAPAEVVGRPVKDVIGADMYRVVEPRLDQALAGEMVRWERTAERGGRTYHQLAEYIPDIGPDGVRGCYALVVDISDRKAAELALKNSEERLLDLTNSIPAMVAYFDMQERCQYANDTALKVQGIGREHLPGITLREALGSSNYAQHDPYVRDVLAGRRARFEGQVSLGGREVHFQAHLIPDRVEGANQRGFYVMTFDITALKQAQQQQARVERQLRAITDNLPVLISYVDSEERILFLNETYRRWGGIDPADVIGRTMEEASRPEHYAQRREYLRRALQGHRVDFELESVTRDTRRSLQNSYIPDVQSDGTVAGIYMLSTDVTALKAVEAQLLELARVDSLTGLPNRRRVEEQLQGSIARASRMKKPLAVLFLDVDHFKAINDRLGHAAGDAVLKEFAARLRTAVRVTDMPGRLAGDEFVILIEGLNDEDEAALVAEKVVSAIRRPFVLGDRLLPVTTSVGVAYCERPGPDSAMLDCADQALYAAKAAGRNTFAIRRLEPVLTTFAAL